MTCEHEKRIVAVRQVEVAGHHHHAAVKLADGSVEDAATVIAAIENPDVHVHYTMIPPEGAPAYEAWQRTALPLELQVRDCPDCAERTLFA